MTATMSDLRTGRSLISDELFGSLVDFVIVHDGETRERAERIADQAVAFVATVATATGRMVPSDDVDKGLHAFILHTRKYAEFCDRIAGRFLHHNPASGGPGRSEDAVAATAKALKASRFEVHDDLWTVDGTSVAQC